MQRVTVGDREIMLNVDTVLAPSVLRKFAGATVLDSDVDALEMPSGPPWLRGCIALLRGYRRIRPASIGQRCVFDPSCSRYAELALRKQGFRRGLVAVLGRLHRCKAGNGGVDLP